MKTPHISYAFDTSKCTFEPASIGRTDLAKKAFLGVLPILWKAIKQKLGRSDGGFTIQDAEKGISLLSDLEIEECLCLE